MWEGEPRWDELTECEVQGKHGVAGTSGCRDRGVGGRSGARSLFLQMRTCQILDTVVPETTSL